MPKYSKKRVKKITDLIRSDSYTIAELCANVGISERCYYDWQANNAEFAENIKKAEEDRLKYFAKLAKKSLVKKLEGYTEKETKTVFIDSGKKNAEGKSTEPKIKEQTITDKHFQPDTTAIIFTLCNAEPENWKNRQNTELTGPGGKDLFAKLTDEELESRITELEKKLSK
jgi:hypothetical protein